MRTGVTALLGASLVWWTAGELPAANPLQTNLKVLRERAAQKPAARKPAPAPRRAPIRRARPARSTSAGSAAASTAPVTYAGERFGSKPRGGDLIVRTSGPNSPTHVYIGQRLLSSSGNGQARVPDLAPGKVSVLVWSPEAGKRRTYWVAIRSGRVAKLEARL